MSAADQYAISPVADIALRASRPVKRSFSIRGHRTSISLEAAFWEALGDIAKHRAMPLAQLVAAVDSARGKAGLSSSVRIFILEHYRSASPSKASPAITARERE